MLMLYRCSDLWGRVTAETPYQGAFVASIWLCLLGGLGLLAAAFLSARPARLSGLLLVLVLCSQWMVHSAFVVSEGQINAPSDTVLLSLHAGILDLMGENPYGYNMADVLSAYNSTGQSSTPHLQGAQVETLPYPALHFLALRPVLAWGLEGGRFLYSFSFSLLLATVFFYAPSHYRPVVLIPVMINPELLHFPFYWASDSIWALLLALMLWHWKRPWARAVLLGLACAYKQTPWLFAPFLAVRILREEEKPWRALAFYTGVSLATFALCNLPYIWADPRAWFQGTFDPMLSPYVSLGRGFSMLMQSNLMPFSKGYFGSLTLLTFALSIWCYFLNYQRLRPLLWWFPAAVLFFSYRSLPNYFIYSVPLLVMELSRYDERELSQPPHRYWYLPLATWLAGALALTVFCWPGPATVSARVIEHRANAAEIEVTNSGTEAFRPNFFARTDWRVFPWQISKGPLVLEPGQTARYTIGTDLNYRTVRVGGQIIVSDGAADQGYRAVVDLPRPDAYRYPRGFEGPQHELWGREGDVWFQGQEIHLATHKGSERAVVSRAMTLPFGELSMELKRPEHFPKGASFGLDVRDQMGKRLSVLLGDRASRGYYTADHFYKILPAQPQWGTYSVNLRALYAESGFALPNLDRMISHDAELIDRPITLSFMLYSKTPVQGAAIRNVRLLQNTTPGHRIADLRIHRQEYQTVLGDMAARRRRFDEALGIYAKAWPMNSAVRTTQEGSFLVVPAAHHFFGRFAMAGWGWGDVKPMGTSLARPLTELLGTIPMLAKPGLEMQLEFEPATGYSVRWDDGPWMALGPGQTFQVPSPAKLRVLSVVPDAAAGLKGIKASANR
jgi:hypothetical protein